MSILISDQVNSQALNFRCLVQLMIEVTIDDIDQLLENRFDLVNTVSDYKNYLFYSHVRGFDENDIPMEFRQAVWSIEMDFDIKAESGEFPNILEAFHEWCEREISKMQRREDARRGRRPSPFDVHNFLADLTKVATAEPIPALFTLNNGAGETEMFMPRGKVSILASEGGLGKSLLSLHLGISLSLNRPTHLRSWCGARLTPRPTSGKVVLLYAEEDLETCLYRLRMQLQTDLGTVNKDLLRQLSGRLIPVPLCVVEQGMDSSLALSDSKRGVGDGANERLERLIDSLNHVAGQEGIDLIVIDPLSQFGGPDFEVDNGEASRLMRNLQQLTLRVSGRPTVLAIHHSSKTAKKGKLSNAIRGSSALKDNARWASVLRRVGEDDTGEKFLVDPKGRGIIELVVAKSNYGPNGLKVRCISHNAKLLDIQEDYLLKANRPMRPQSESWEAYRREILEDDSNDASSSDGSTAIKKGSLWGP